MVDVIRSKFPRLTQAQTFVIAAMVVAMVVWNVSFWILQRNNIKDTAILYDYRGTTGPYEVVKNAAGQYETGEQVSSIKAGGLIAWTTDICLREDVRGLAVTEITRMLAPGDGEEVVSRIEIPIQPGRCGPRTVARLVPFDAPPGYYELRRLMMLTVNRHPLPPIDLPHLHIRVERP